MPERMSWRKQPNEKGLARSCQSTRGFELRSGKIIIARVAPLTSLHRTVIGWYWYGGEMNSLSRHILPKSFASAEEAKVDCLSYMKEARNAS